MPSANGGSQFDDDYAPANWGDNENLKTVHNMNVIEEITKAVTQSAQKARDNAGYGGSWDDGGAGNKEERLKYWLDGIAYARTGETKVYGELVQKLKNEVNPEYQEFLRLKEKFKE